MKIDGNKLLILYSAALTAAAVFSIGSGAVASNGPGNAKFDTIDVKRINVREDDGTLRMIVTNSSRSPGIIVRGKDRPHPSGNRGAGILFFNNEGTENGGLTFHGQKGPDGKVSSSGHISFDQYEQDQVIQLTQIENNGKRWAGMVITDRPDGSLFADLDRLERIEKMPDGPEKKALLEKIETDGTFGRRRVFVGKSSRDRSSSVVLSDAMGRSRIALTVLPEGAASIDFLDEKGNVVRSLKPE